MESEKKRFRFSLQISFERERRTLLVSQPDPSGRRDYSEETAREIDNEVHRLIEEQIDRVSRLPAARRATLLRATEVLMTRETVTGHELRALVDAADSADEERSSAAPL